MSDRILKVANLCKKFTMDSGHVNTPGFRDILKSLVGYKFETRANVHDFWALKDISFDLSRGENLGIVGLNGAGKSTLLKIILDRLSPDSGEVEINGKVGGLIELGAGFHPEQTGRKNVLLNARLLGISNEEIEAKMAEIISFAELGEFIDMPVKTYSSGMAIRLGFSVAIHFVQDLIVCDEILAVGDFEFKQKCYRKIHELKKSRSFILVSHGTRDISLFCDKALLLHRGRVVMYGDVDLVLEKYAKASHDLSYDEYVEKLNDVTSLESAQELVSATNLLDSRYFSETEEFRISKFGRIFRDFDAVDNVKVYCSASCIKGRLFAKNSEELVFTVQFDLLANISSLRIGLPIFTENGDMILGPDSRDIDPNSRSVVEPGPKCFKFTFPRCPLNEGRFFVALAINNDPGYLFRDHLAWIEVKNVTQEFGQVRSEHSTSM